jgi:hypothetical protein
MLMSASETRNKMNEINSEKELDQLKKIENAINSDTKKGYTYIGFSPMATVKQQLLSLGYRIEDLCSQKEGTCYKITW